MHKHLFLTLSVSCSALLTLSACSLPVSLATGAAATTGIAAAQEGGISRAVSDVSIKAHLNDLWLKKDLDMFSKLSSTVENGRVLITGVVQQPEHRVEAVRLAWQVPGVKQVINEIRVADSEGITGYVRDSWISTRLRTALTFDKNVQSINYSIDTVQGVIYLMGYAQNEEEHHHVTEIARRISGVKQVVSYVKLVGIDPNDTIRDDSLYDTDTAPNAGTDEVTSEPIDLSQ